MICAMILKISINFTLFGVFFMLLFYNYFTASDKTLSGKYAEDK